MLVIGILFVGTMIKDFFLIINNILVARLAQRATFDLRKLFYRRTLRMDLATFSKDGTADLMSRFTNDMTQVAVGLGIALRQADPGAAEDDRLPGRGGVGSAGDCCCLSLVIAPLAGYLVRWLARTLKRANRRAMEEVAVIYTTLEETFRSIKIVKAFTNERQERKQFHDNSKSYYQKAMRIARYDALSHPMTEVLGITAISTAMLAGVWLVFSKETHLFGIRMTDRPLDWGWLGTFYALLAAAADPARKLSDVFSRLQAASAAADRIFSRLDRQPEIRDPKHPIPFHPHHRDLVFENVGFAYQPGKAVLGGGGPENSLRRNDRHCGPQRLR